LGRTGLLTIGIGVVLLAVLVGLGHVLWTRSAESEIVHYSWPVKWALTLAAESPDLPTGSRFTTVSVRTVRGSDHWTVAGELELPSVNESRLVTSYEATVKSLCSDVAERRCWKMEALTLGSVPATVPNGSNRAPKAHIDTPSNASVIAALTPSSEEPSPPTVPTKPTAQDEDLAFIFKEPMLQAAAAEASAVSPRDKELEFILAEVEPGGGSLQELDDGLQVAEPKASRPHYDPTLVRNIQSGLTALGYDPGPVDGIAGRQTRTAIESFRQRERLASGEISAELLDAIRRRLSVTEPAPVDNYSPPQLQQPQDARKQPWSCSSVNPKIRDCGG
jgi:hypothetical protein